MKVPSSGSGLKWGADGGGTGASAASSGPAGGSTYNITNNNNINYNYGSNITAISSDTSGPVPTFHDIEKRKKEGDKSYTSSTLGYIGNSIGSVTSKGVGLGGVTTSIQSSKGLAQMSDAIKRNTGLDIHKALGGKTAVQLAEERLKKE